MQEQDLGVRVTRTVQTQKSNKIAFKRLSTTLQEKKPTYSDVKIEATKHDTLYNKLKTTFAAKVSQQLTVNQRSNEVKYSFWGESGLYEPN